MILGIGVDVVDIARFERTLSRTPSLADRLFVAEELGRPISSIAARFAAKEALIKASGDSTGFRWHDMVVRSSSDGRPSLIASGAVRERLDAIGVAHLHLSLSHDVGIASAFVVLEGVA